MPERTGHDDGVRAGIVAGVLGALVLVIFAAAGVAYALASGWGMPRAGANAAAAMHIAGPALESAPQDERARYDAEKRAVLERYEWVDRKHGIARIPIGEAMKIVQTHPHPNPPPEGEGTVGKTLLPPQGEGWDGGGLR